MESEHMLLGTSAVILALSVHSFAVQGLLEQEDTDEVEREHMLLGTSAVILALSVHSFAVQGLLEQEDTDEVESEHLLLGTSAVILALPPPPVDQDNLETYWLESQLRLVRLLQAKPLHPSVPLLVLPLGWGTDPGEDVQEYLDIRGLTEGELVSDCRVVDISSDVEDEDTCRKLCEALCWLGDRAPLPPCLETETLRDYIENSLAGEFSSVVYQDAAQRRKAGLPQQTPGPIVCLYNSLVEHLARVASSNNLQALSWPVAEFVMAGHRTDLLSLDWNSETQLTLLQERILALRLPPVPYIDGDESWSSVCQYCTDYVLSLPADSKEQTVLLTSVALLPSRCESAAGRSRCYCGPRPAYLPVQPTTFPSRRLARLGFHAAPCLHARLHNSAAYYLPESASCQTRLPCGSMPTCSATHQCSLLHSRVGALPDSASMRLHAYMLAPQCSLATFPSRPLDVLGVTAVPGLHTYHQCSLLHSRVGALPDSSSMRLHAYMLRSVASLPSRVGRWTFSVLLRCQACILTSAARVGALPDSASMRLHAYMLRSVNIATFPSRPLDVLGVTAVPGLHTYQCSLLNSRVGALPDSVSMWLHAYMFRSVASLPSRVGRWTFSVLLRLRWLLDRVQTEFEDTCYLDYDVPNCEPTAAHVPWTRLVEMCVSHMVQRLDWAGQDGSVLTVHYLPEELSGFTQPPEWRAAVGNTSAEVLEQPHSLVVATQQSVRKKHQELSRVETIDTVTADTTDGNLKLEDKLSPAVSALIRKAEELRKKIAQERVQTKSYEDWLQVYVEDGQYQHQPPGVSPFSSPEDMREQPASPPGPDLLDLTAQPRRLSLEENLEELRWRIAAGKRDFRLSELRLNSLLDMGDFQAKHFHLVKSWEVTSLAIDMRRLQARVRRERAWAPLDLAAIVGEQLTKTRANQSKPAVRQHANVYWKLVLSLPDIEEESPATAQLCKWLQTKLKKGSIPDSLGPSLSTDSHKLQTLSLYTAEAGVPGKKICICTKGGQVVVGIRHIELTLWCQPEEVLKLSNCFCLRHFLQQLRFSY
uniref:Germinal-centre associated nuclear protein MCM3AP domain-containing protein n=1 Tax=Branchiostoma floridae TaxID=7739 RepID=C3ZGT2_BRAFL|eukprot:XP_002592297.1 hypothetical protein BRAFLDRAFT_71037 [Branchiostoma floridae]